MGDDVSFIVCLMLQALKACGADSPDVSSLAYSN